MVPAARRNLSRKSAGLDARFRPGATAPVRKSQNGHPAALPGARRAWPLQGLEIAQATALSVGAGAGDAAGAAYSTLPVAA